MINLQKKQHKLGFTMAEALIVMLIVMLLTLAASPMISKKRARIKANATHGEWTCSENSCPDWQHLPNTVKHLQVEVYSGGGGGSRGSVKPWETSTKHYNFGESVEHAGEYEVVFNYKPSHKSPQLDFSKILEISQSKWEPNTWEYTFAEFNKCGQFSGNSNGKVYTLDDFIPEGSVSGTVKENGKQIYAYCKRMSYDTHACYTQLFAGDTKNPDSHFQFLKDIDYIKRAYFNGWTYSCPEYEWKYTQKLYQMANDNSYALKYNYNDYADSIRWWNGARGLGLDTGCLPVDHSCHHVFYLGNEDGTISDFASRVNARTGDLASKTSATMYAVGKTHYYTGFTNEVLPLTSSNYTINERNDGSHYFYFLNSGAGSGAVPHKVVNEDGFAKFESCSKYLAKEGDYCIHASYKKDSESGSDVWDRTSFMPNFRSYYNLGIKWTEDYPTEPHHRFTTYVIDSYHGSNTSSIHTTAELMRNNCIRDMYGYEPTSLTYAQKEKIRKDGNCSFVINNGSYDGVMYANPPESKCTYVKTFPAANEPYYTHLKLIFKTKMLPGEKITAETITAAKNKTNNDHFPQKADNGVISHDGDTVNLYHYKAVKNGNSLSYRKVLVAKITGAKVAKYGSTSNCSSANNCKSGYGKLQGYHNALHGMDLTLSAPENLKIEWFNGYGGDKNVAWNTNSGDDGYSTSTEAFVSTAGCPGQNGKSAQMMIQNSQSFRSNLRYEYGAGGLGETELNAATKGGSTRFGSVFVSGGNSASGKAGSCKYEIEPSPNPYDSSTSLGGRAGGISTNGTPQRDYNFPAEKDIEPKGRWQIEDGGSGSGGYIKVTW